MTATPAPHRLVNFLENRPKQHHVFMMPFWRFNLLIICCAISLYSQRAPLAAPSITASAKGPNQINLTWRGAANPGYGYVVEIHSIGDSRYSSWQELRPLPDAQGYTCDNSIVIRGSRCDISDPSGGHIYNLPNNGVPYWVTESNYIDPQDDSPTQFIAWGLKAKTQYSFRVRSYAGMNANEHSDYSNVAAATTAAYELRYVSPAGKDTNDGLAPEPAHAWKTLAHGSAALACGQELIVMGGSYSADLIIMTQSCSAIKKAVVMVNPGDEATITSVLPGAEHTMVLSGSYLVIDGIKSVSSSVQHGDYDIQITGNHIALLNIETHPAVIPTFRGGVALRGGHNLLYRSYLHDAGSPDAGQNPSGNGGFVLVVEGSAAAGNVIWSNHLTRGGHDVSLCIRDANHNRWMNNVMDGGWGMGWEAVQGAQYNLLEGNMIYDVGQLVSFYKPSIEISSAHNTARRNISVKARTNALEVSALYGGDTVVHTRVYNNLFYAPNQCYFQSHNGGSAAYDNGIYQNNICYRFAGIATDIYLDNRIGHISYNDFLAVDAAGDPQPNKPIIIWSHSAEGQFQYPKPMSYADTNYAPPFSHNASLAVAPRFTDEVKLDFHLSGGTALIGAGSTVDDPDWGGVSGKPDLGAFGINPSSYSVPPVPVRNATVGAPAPPAPPSHNIAPSQNEPRFGVPEMDRPTPTCIGIRLPVAADLSYKSVVMVRYREAGGSVWREALPLFRVHPEVVTGWDVQPQFSGSIFDLMPNSTYDVELHMVDPDRDVDQRVTLLASTRGLPHDPREVHKRLVHNAEELAAAFGSAQPGDVIDLTEGVYYGEFRIAAAGTAENPVVIRGASAEGTILDGRDCADCNVLEVYGTGHVHIENVTIRNAERAIRFQTNGAEANVVRRVHTFNTRLGITGRPDQKDFYICDNTLEGRLKWPLFYNADDGAHANDDGIQVMGYGHVVCHNQISGFGDAMKTEQRGARAVDFYNNDIRYSYDNGVELDEGAGNIRCFRNRFLNTYSPLSVQPIYGGPAYILRNVVVNVVDEQMKFHALGGTPPQEPSGILAVNNTFVSSQVALNVQTPAMSHFFLVANNLFVGPEGAGLSKVVNWDAPFATGVFDYNGYFPDGIFYFNMWKERVKQFPALSALGSSGLETHGVALTPPIFQSRFGIEQNARVFVSPLDLTLAPDSRAVDRGVYLPNVNDGFTGSAPDLGAIERECPAPIYGPRAVGMDESNTTAGCSIPANSNSTLSSTDAMLLMARATGGAPSRTISIIPRTPRAIADEALLLAARGDLGGAFGRFNATNFPQPRQEEFVREAYFELRVQRLLDLSVSRKCSEADRGITELGSEDKNVPFSFLGFGLFLKRLRTQYLIASVELACVDAKSARKRWEKVSRGVANMESIDYTYPYLALAKLDSESAKDKVAGALESVRRALETATLDQRGLLLYHQGLLLIALGQIGEAKTIFRDGAMAATGMVQYLHREVLRTLDKPE